MPIPSFDLLSHVFQPLSPCVIMSCCQYTLLVTLYSICRNLSAIQDREICCYSVSCKEKDNIGKHKASYMGRIAWWLALAFQ